MKDYSSSGAAASSENYGTTFTPNTRYMEIEIHGLYEQCTCEYTFRKSATCKRHNGSGLKKMRVPLPPARGDE